MLGAVLCAALCAFIVMPRAQETALDSEGLNQSPKEEEGKNSYWYLVDQDNGPDLTGRSPLDPVRLGSSMAGAGFLHLEDCRQQDAMGTWTATGGEHLTGTVYVRASLVRSYTPLKSDPLTWAPPAKQEAR